MTHEPAELSVDVDVLQVNWHQAAQQTRQQNALIALLTTHCTAYRINDTLIGYSETVCSLFYRHSPIALDIYLKMFYVTKVKVPNIS